MNTDTQERVKRLEELIQATDGNDRSAELIRSLMELHGSCLERLMEIVSRHGVAGVEISQAFVKDESVSALLLLYGLHPLGFEDRIRNAIKSAKESIAAHGANVELESMNEGRVRVRLSGNGHGCQAPNLKAMIEQTLIDAAPDLDELIIDEVLPESKPVFVPIQRLPVSKAAVTS